MEKRELLIAGEEVNMSKFASRRYVENWTAASITLTLCSSIALALALGVVVPQLKGRLHDLQTITITGSGNYTVRWDNGNVTAGALARYELQRVHSGQFNYTVLVLYPTEEEVATSLVASNSLEVVANSFSPDIQDTIVPYLTYSVTNSGYFRVSKQALNSFNLACVEEDRCFFNPTSEEGYWTVATGPLELTGFVRPRTGNAVEIGEPVTFSRPIRIELYYLN